MSIKASLVVNKRIVLIENKENFDFVDLKFTIETDYLLFTDQNGKPTEIYSKLQTEIYKNIEVLEENDYLLLGKEDCKIYAVQDSIGNLVGVITPVEILKFLLNQINSIENEHENVLTDLNAFMSCSEDLACISDGNGSKVRVSTSCKKYYGLSAESLIGKNVKELEKVGMYFPSATRLVIEEKKPVTVTQKTKTGRKLLVNASPVFNSEGQIVRVVSISKDITNEEKLKAELAQTKNLLEKYENELISLRMDNLNEKDLIFRSKSMEQMLEVVKKVAPLDSTVLIHGETGVGKEVVAKYIFKMSNRISGPFIKINCGAIPENLLEAELFGYEKGAFTGARSEGKPGLMEIADKGTLFLDEISELPLQLQVKLLRVIQEKEFMRVGGIKAINVDVRIISASNKDLGEQVKKGAFRQDLYYRLNVIPISIPPLRERIEDIPVLSHYFLSIYNKKYGRSKQFTKDVIEAFMNYSWPGNVRELENIVERLIIISENNQITRKDLSKEILNDEELDKSQVINVSKLIPLKEATAITEYLLIEQAIKEAGSSYKAAEILGIDQSTLVRKMKKYRSIN